MSEGNSIINVGDLSKPATVLIEKISNAIGVLYEPRKIKNLAAAEVEAERIKTIGRLELTEIQERAIERLVFQETKKQENIESITSQAIENLPPNAKAENLDEDWIAHFFKNCESVSDKEMQTLWSSLLSGEASNPGKYSKRTIDFVASMDKGDAELFTKFCQFTWIIGDATPVIFDLTNEIYEKNGINFSTMKHLDSIGLISFESTTGYVKQGFGKNGLILYFGIPTMLEFEKDKENKLKVGTALFTKAGQELFLICGAKRNEDFYQYAIKKFSDQKICLSSLLLNQAKQAGTR